MKTIILAAAGFCIACAVAGLLLLKQPPAHEEASPTAKAASSHEPGPAVAEALPAAPSEEVPPAAAESVATPTPSAAPEAAPSASPAPADKKVRNAQASQAGGGGKEPLKDPLAREALALVGLDPAAEAYWGAAINDADLSGHERQDLIEDLNEEGLSDPKNPVPEDLPVILNRLQLIEAHGPYAMDQVNADAFAEAYKDLMNLANRALGGGGPVR